MRDFDMTVTPISTPQTGDYIEHINLMRKEFKDELSELKKSIKKVSSEKTNISSKELEKTITDTIVDSINTQMANMNVNLMMADIMQSIEDISTSFKYEVTEIKNQIKNSTDNISEYCNIEKDINDKVEIIKSEIEKANEVYADVIKLQYKFNTYLVNKVEKTILKELQENNKLFIFENYKSLCKYTGRKDIIAVVRKFSFLRLRGLYIYNGKKWVRV